MESIDPVSLKAALKFWETVSEIGFVAVIVGVVGEGVALVKEWWEWLKHQEAPKLKFRWILPVETSSFLILVIGLAVEFIGSHRAMSYADNLNAILEKQSAELNKQNLVLRSNVVELEKAVEWRTITPEQAKTLTARLRPIMQNPTPFLTNLVTVDVSREDFEARRYAEQITGVLKDCGLEVKFAPNIWFHPAELQNRVGMEIFGNGMNAVPFETAIFSAFQEAKIANIGNFTIRTNGVDNGDGSVHIWVWHKPER